ncbi:hypothetical protein AB870_06360 [Pandoraea faecigallinarum]|uniref:Proteinase inhibitor I42 chagasin domain-containing protein n=1 Tax=Pandoraea faecigallinarum TaxID=656179 RepID=A0A0H3WTF8_9BURK|nr:hypothetical protein [Pandoraea faecigallinarum]AKM29816.1 hypothetical protein AB870_06360 [Pandoraea faecigallinarum]
MDTTGVAWRAALFAVCMLGASTAGASPPFPPDTIEVEAAVGQKVPIWEQSNYSVLCRDLGTPTFELDSKPALGEVTPEWITYTVPVGQRCEQMKFSGMIVWYQAGSTPGTDEVVWTVGFPREFGSRTPGSGEHRVTTKIVIR